MSMIWQQLGRSDYDDATLNAEMQQPIVDGNAWLGLRNALIGESTIGLIVYLVLRLFR